MTIRWIRWPRQPGVLRRRARLDGGNDRRCAALVTSELQAVQVKFAFFHLLQVGRTAYRELHGPRQFARAAEAAAVEKAADASQAQSQHQAGRDQISQRQARQLVLMYKDDQRQPRPMAEPNTTSPPWVKLMTSFAVSHQLSCRYCGQYSMT